MSTAANERLMQSVFGELAKSNEEPFLAIVADEEAKECLDTDLGIRAVDM